MTKLAKRDSDQSDGVSKDSSTKAEDLPAPLSVRLTLRLGAERMSQLAVTVCRYEIHGSLLSTDHLIGLCRMQKELGDDSSAGPTKSRSVHTRHTVQQ